MLPSPCSDAQTGTRGEHSVPAPGRGTCSLYFLGHKSNSQLLEICQDQEEKLSSCIFFPLLKS